MENQYQVRQSWSRNISTPTLRSGKLPPVQFFPSGSPLHNTYKDLLRKATLKSRSSKSDGIWDSESNEPPIKVPGRSDNKSRPAYDRRNIATASSNASSATTSAIENLHFTQHILRRATSSQNQLSTPISQQSASLTGSEARLEVALDHGASVDDLKKNQELVDVLNDVQQVTICFQEIIRHLSYHRVETGRVLWKLQKTYINLFERLVSAMFRNQEKKVSGLKKANNMRDEEMDLLRLKVLDLNKRLEAAERTKQAQIAIIHTEELKSQSMEAEINDLRAALVSEVKSAEKESERRAKEDEDIRKQLESDLKQQESKRAALFGQSGAGELDEAFAKSIGKMNDTIGDAEEMVYNQDKLLSDMDSLLMMQKEKMFDDIKNASLSVREKIMEKISLNQKLENSSASFDKTNPGTAAEVTNEALVMKENEIKALDQKISLGSEIDAILETQHLEAIADPTKMIEERESRAARYREQRAREEIEQQRANMIQEMNKMKRDIKKKEDAILLEMQNKSVQTPPPSRGDNEPSTVATGTGSKTSDGEENVDEFNGDVKDAMTQTVVDEECLWESEDTYVVAISGPVLEKVWRERNEAVEKFYGEFVAKRKQDPLAGPDEDPATAKPQTNIDLPKSLKTDQKKKVKRKGQWLITPIIRDFMANIPKTVQAQAIKPLSWLSKTIDLLYQSKLAADYLDLRDGDPLQSLNDFLTEFLLMKYKLRRVAEMHMYEIIMCVKKYYKKNSKVRMFAKFLGCVKDKASDEDTKEKQNKPELDIGVLQVFLYVRNRLLTPPKELEIAVPQTPTLGNNTSNYDESHVALTHDCKTFVPLGHAIKEMRRVSSFMARRKLEKFLRTVERAVAIRHLSGKIKPVDGERMQVRFTMRAAMLDNVKSHEEMMEESQNNDVGSKVAGDDSADIQVVADVDVCLEILIEILEIREKQIYNSLIRAFVDGDDNGDGILDIDEFTEIIKVLKPSYSSRRALRMFKRALEQGEENSSSLERHAFVQTCKEYGLALLVDTRALDLADAEKMLAANVEAPRTASSTGIRSRKTSSKK